MISASAYKEVTHDVLVINAKTLVGLEEPNIRLSWMNSGCTKPIAHPRDMSLVKRFQDYPFEIRKKTRGRKGAVAEVCVLERVERIKEAIIDVKRGVANEILAELVR